MDIWTSFCKVNNRYNEVKLNYEAYTLEEVLIILHGDGYLFRIQELKYELRDKERQQEISCLKSTVEKISKKLSVNIFKNKQLELYHNKSKIQDFMSQYLVLQKDYDLQHAIYLKQYKALKQQLHSGTLEGDYHHLLSEISKNIKIKKHGMSNMANKFMYETFGKNPNSIGFKDVLKFYKHNI